MTLLPAQLSDDENYMQLINLRERPEAIAEIAPWHFAQWRSLFPHKTLADFAADLAMSLQPGQVPQTWLLLDLKERIIGTGSLLVHDMTDNQELSPWLANIYIHPDYRGHGYGKVIVRHVMAQAQALGFARLYLFTEDQQAFYQTLGWQLLKTQLYEGEWVSVMQWQCDPSGA